MANPYPVGVVRELPSSPQPTRQTYPQSPAVRVQSLAAAASETLPFSGRGAPTRSPSASLKLAEPRTTSSTLARPQSFGNALEPCPKSPVVIANVARAILTTGSVTHPVARTVATGPKWLPVESEHVEMKLEEIHQIPNREAQWIFDKVATSFSRHTGLVRRLSSLQGRLVGRPFLSTWLELGESLRDL